MLGVEAAMHLGRSQADPRHDDQLQRPARYVRGLRALLQGAAMKHKAAMAGIAAVAGILAESLGHAFNQMPKSDWKSDPARIAAAEDKRARRAKRHASAQQRDGK